MANRSVFSWELYHKAPIVGIIRGLPLDTILQITQVYQEAGFHTLEITMNTEGAEEIITTLKNEFPDLNVGAGTVCNTDDLNKALAAGAQFLVTPILDEAVVAGSVAQGIPVFPGAYSPTEIYRAWALGAAAVKVFPASQLGVQYIKEVSAPLNDIKLLPTGGVSLENIKAFFEAGAAGVGMGSSLFDKRMVREGDMDGLKRHLGKVLREIKAFVNTG